MPSSSRYIAGAVAIGFLVLGILYFDIESFLFDATDFRYYVLNTPKGYLWAFLVCVQATSWAFAYLTLVPATRLTWRASLNSADAHKWDVMFILAAVLVLPVAGVFSHDSRDHIPNHHLKVAVLVVLSTPAVILVATEMLRIRKEFSQLPSTASFNSVDMTTFTTLRDRMNQLLLLMGGMFSALALGTGAFRSAHNAIPDAVWRAHGMAPAKIEVEDFLVYCAFYSMPIVAAFTPTYAAFRAAGDELVAIMAPMNGTDTQTWTKTMQDRSALEKLLQIDKGMTEQLKNGIIVLSPVLSGAASLLLPTK